MRCQRKQGLSNRSRSLDAHYNVRYIIVEMLQDNFIDYFSLSYVLDSHHIHYSR